MQLTMVAVNGMLSIKEDAMADTQTTRMMAVARRRSSGTIWKGADNSSAMYHSGIDINHTYCRCDGRTCEAHRAVSPSFHKGEDQGSPRCANRTSLGFPG